MLRKSRYNKSAFVYLFHVMDTSIEYTLVTFHNSFIKITDAYQTKET